MLDNNMVKLIIIKRTVLLIVLLNLLSQGTTESSLLHRAMAQENTYWPDDDWRISMQEDQNMDPEMIQDIKSFIDTEKKLISSLIIIRNGYLVEEEYFGRSDSYSLNPIYSVTKSIIATLIGIAIQEGYINSIHDKVLEFFPDFEFENANGSKQDMTIYHLLTMTCGLDWNEWWVSYNSINNDLTAVKTTEDWVQYILDKPMADEPGTVMNYNTGASHILSAIITQAYGNSTEAFAIKYLFEPLGITKYSWLVDSSDITRGGEGLSLRAIDMAKIGYLYLNNGTWNGVSIVNSDWIENTTTAKVNFDYEFSYGYQWWIYRNNPTKTYFAWGWAGQRIFVIPEKDLVVIFTSYDFSYSLHLFLLNQYILPATEYVKPEPATEDPSTIYEIVTVTNKSSFFNPALLMSLLVVIKFKKASTRRKQ